MHLRFGLQNVSVDPLTAVELGVLAERNGLDSLWVPDHFVDVDGDRLDPWTVLAAVAVKTKKITLGAAVTDTQRSHPARTAHQVISLDVISRGRAILGIGAGESFNVTPFGLPWGTPEERVQRMVEAINVIRLLWSSSRSAPVNFSGAFFRLDNAFLSQQPLRKSGPPIYVGAFASRRALKVVGEMADGWFAWLHTPETFTTLWNIVRNAARAARRSISEVEPCVHFLVAFPRNSSERKAAILSAKLALLMEKRVLASFGYRVETAHYQHVGVGERSVSRLLEAAENVPEEYVHKVAAIGGQNEVEEKIERLSKAGVRHFAMQGLLAPSEVKRNLTLFGKVVRRYR